jgi:hypothetical protein
MARGQFTIPTRVYLTSEQREKLFVMARDHGVDLADLLTELLASFLDHLPDYTPTDAVPPEPAPVQETEISERRAELRRLRARAVAGGETAPPWLQGYIADLEQEIARREQK